MLAAIFWISVALIVYTHAGYPPALWLLSRLRRAPEPPPGIDDSSLPSVTLIVAAHDEEDVITAKVSNALALDYPRDRLELVITSDGSSDATAARAREAGADRVLELPRGGKIVAQNAAVEAAGGEVLAFSDANSEWHPAALRELVAALMEDGVGYACGQVRFVASDGDNPEGAYWSYEMAVRRLESGLGGVTAGNGGIYAVRREAYIALRPSGSHDLSFPFELAKRGLRSVYQPEALAEERMVPSLGGELRRKRRMMVGLWDIVIGERMASPRGYGALYGFQIASHRIIRYATPLLHLVALVTNIALLGHGWVYTATLVAQVALLAAALLAPLVPIAPLRLCRYYVMVTASIALGLWDRLRHGPPAAWQKAEGTR